MTLPSSEPRPAAKVLNKRKPKRMARLMRLANPTIPEDQPRMTPEEFIKTIDTRLTPEQREHVEKIKKKVKGSFRSPRCKLPCRIVLSLAHEIADLTITYSYVSRCASTRRDEVRRFASCESCRERGRARGLRL
jgi:hypothetical protein